MENTPKEKTSLEEKGVYVSSSRVQTAIHPDLLAWHDEFTAVRRDIHAHPELGFEEKRTSELIVKKLKEIGVDDIHQGLAKTGVVATIFGKNKNNDPDKAIALRCDIDALPMTEENTFAHKSTIPGKMHGCGHDGHTAILLMAAKYLAKHRNFDGTAHLIFQPAEEGGAGANVMIQEGLFEKFPVKSVWGMHNFPNMPFGTIGVRGGPAMAAADEMEIVVHGKGAHAAYPHLGKDPVVIASQLIIALQSIVSRNLNPFSEGVISVPMFHSGSAHNVIADKAVLGGTIRSFAPKTRDMLHKRVREVCDGMAAAFDTKIELKIFDGYPATINSQEESLFAADIAKSILGSDKVDEKIEPSMGAEDFAFMLEKKPGCYIRLGTGKTNNDPGLHDTRFDFNDDAIPLGASYWVNLVETALPLK